MKKVKEKVKDIVEVRQYESVPDFLNDPAKTVSNYHFSDVTSELMVKWLDSLSTVGSNGACRALAGYRGVGKSHFLAMVSAIASLPEMRSRIDESYVSAGCQRLLRRHYPVVNIRRGLRNAFIEEIADAIKSAFATESLNPTASIAELLESAKRSAGDLPLIVLIDTASDRSARVERNDGPALAEIADVANKLGIFVGLALDDDIAGADGANSAIASQYTIDFLDQEHLYKVVNSRIFPKNSRMQGVLGDIYAQFREAMPHFRWSEQRFASLYPLHPATLDVSPYIRLYTPDFAILGFAATAGERILGRPADSLIGLEEIFDAAEAGLRKSKDLETAFASYDRIAEKCIGSLPISERHRAKLILKALFLLSLDGRGSTVGELAASLMIFDERSGQSGSEDVRRVVEAFAAADPESLTVSTSADSVCYLLKVRSDENLTLLDTAVSSLPENALQKVLTELLRARFPELQKEEVDQAGELEFVDLKIEWRGGLRPGRICFDLGIVSRGQFEVSSDLDWDLIVSFENYNEADDERLSNAKIQWRPDPLREDEIRTLLSHHLLLTDTEIRTKFGDQLPAALHAHGSAAEAIIERVMLADARLSLDGFDYNFSESARSAPTLSEVLSIMLEPLFETRFPEHPYFAKTLTEDVLHTFVARLLADPLSHSPADEELARTFGVPLGLAVLNSDGSVASSISNIPTLPSVKLILDSIPLDPAKILEVKTISSSLSAPPLGLVKEAQRLLLACLVSSGAAEFVTRSGGRVNGRSLDLKVAWDEVAGIALPRSAVYDDAQITQWARLITKNKAVGALDSPDDRALVLSSLVDLSAAWKRSDMAAGNDNLPDTEVNLEVWGHTSKPVERFALMMRSIEDALLGEIDLEECILNVCNIYGGDVDLFEQSQASLSAAASFSKGFEERQRILSYLQLADPTSDPSVENARDSLFSVLELARSDPSDSNNRDLGYAWEKFARLYRDYYCARHEMVMRTNDVKSRYAEIIASEKWRYFSQLLSVDLVRSIYQPRIREIRRQMIEYGCSLDPTSHLEHSPYCSCLFRLSSEAQTEDLPVLLWSELDSAVSFIDQYLSEHRFELLERLHQEAPSFESTGISREAAEVAIMLAEDGAIGRLTEDQILILAAIMDQRNAHGIAPSPHAKDISFGSLQRELATALSAPLRPDIPDQEQVLSFN